MSRQIELHIAAFCAESSPAPRSLAGRAERAECRALRIQSRALPKLKSTATDMGETLTTMNYYHSHELNLKAMESTDMIDTSTSTVEEHASRSKEGVGPRSGIYFQKFKSELYPLTVDPHDFDPRPQTPDPQQRKVRCTGTVLY